MKKNILRIIIGIFIFLIISYVGLNIKLTGQVTDQGIINITIIGNVTEEEEEEVPTPSPAGGGGAPSKVIKLCNPEWKCYENTDCKNVDDLFERGDISENLKLKVKDRCYFLGFKEENCGYKRWECFDLNYCGDNSTMPNPWSACDTAVPTCKDEIKNQGEEGIDCGGPCKACLEIPYVPLKIPPKKEELIVVFIILSIIIIIMIIKIIQMNRKRRELENKKIILKKKNNPKK